MAILTFVILFVFGLCVGSFLNVIIYRLPRGLDFVKGRSFCPRCKKKINWFDNIPLLSFFLLGGKCRNCKKPISLRYPLVELITGILTVLVISFQLASLRGRSGSSVLSSPRFAVEAGLQTVYLLLLVWSLIPIFFIDLEHQIIPDQILVFMGLVSFILTLTTNHPARLASPAGQGLALSGWLGEAGRQSLVTNYLPTAIVSAGFFLFLFLITRGKGMGLGDVKFAFLIGLVLGFPKVIPAFYLAFLTGAIVGIILILVKKAKFGRPIPFGPFLVMGMLIIMFFGERLLRFLGQMLPS